MSVELKGDRAYRDGVEYLLTTVAMSDSRSTRGLQTLPANHLRLFSYIGIAFVTVFLYFALGESHSIAGAPDTIDLTIKTAGPNEIVALPLGTGNTFTNLTITWGDGGATSVVANASDTVHMKHTYGSSGNHFLTVGAPTGGSIVQFGNGAVPWVSGAAYVSAVTYFSPTLQSLSGAFFGAATLTAITATLPTSIKDLSHMFDGAVSINDSNISSWVTTNVTNTSYMFSQATSFDQSVSSWNMSSVTNMSYMFYDALVFTNFGGALTSWNTSSATNMSWMFAGATSFNSDIHTWDTHLVTNMSYMFYGGVIGPVTTSPTIFNDAGVAMTTNGSQWNVSAVTAFDYMFANDSAINIALSNWNAGSVASTMSNMFALATVFNQNLNTWSVSKPDYSQFLSLSHR